MHGSTTGPARGRPIRDVADYLGHSDPSFTLRVYAHLMPSAPDKMRAAAEAAQAACEADVASLGAEP